MGERPEIVRWTGTREALRPDEVTAAPVLDDGELLDRLLVIVGDARARLDEIHDPAVTEVSRWLRVQVGDLLVARAASRPDPASVRMDDLLDDRPPDPAHGVHTIADLFRRRAEAMERQIWDEAVADVVYPSRVSPPWRPFG